VSINLQKYYSVEKDGDLYYTLCGHTLESATRLAKEYSGDNYHV